MMSSSKWRRQRKVLWRWVRWAPVLGLVFGVLGADAWLNNETRNNDYAFTQTRAKIRETQAELHDIKAKKAELETMNRLLVQAKRMGMVKPGPADVATLRYDTADIPPIFTDPMELATNEVWSLFDEEERLHELDAGEGESVQVAGVPETDAGTAEGEPQDESAAAAASETEARALREAAPVVIASVQEPSPETVSAILVEGEAAPRPAVQHQDDDGEEREEQDGEGRGGEAVMLDIPPAPADEPGMLDESVSAMLGDF